MYSLRGLGSSSSVQDLISSMAPGYGVPPSLALAVAQTESGFNQSAVSPKGAIGVMQLMPGTASDLGVDPHDLTQNVQGGLSYLSKLYNQFGDWDTALAAYNAGPGNIPAGAGYAQKVLALSGDVSAPSVSSASVVGEDTGAFDYSQFSTGQLSTGAWLALAALGVGLVVLAVTR